LTGIKENIVCLTRLSVDLPAVNAGYDYAVLTGKSNTFSYSDGRRISDEAIGVKLTVALQGARFAPLTIRYSHDPLPKVNDEDIEAACVSNNLIYVQIPDCVVNLYSSNSGGIGMTATAQTAQIVTLNSK